MALPQPIAVAAAVAGGEPTDVREWIAVDIVGAPSVHRRGLAVLVEPLNDDGRSRELAQQVRDVVLGQLRLHARQAPDAALVHAFGIANALVCDDGRSSIGPPALIGLTAIIFEDSVATIGHLPPGQLILVQDHLVYSVPDLDSYLPHWASADADGPPAEPLGFSSWVAPVLVQTELLPGDTLLLCNTATASALAYGDTGPPLELRRYFARDPEDVLDDVRTTALNAGERFAAVAVISFPPNPVASEIETLADVGRSAREQMRHMRAAVRAITPTLPQRQSVPTPVEEEEISAPAPAPAVPRISLQERLIRITEGRPTEGGGTWQPRRPEAQFGAPGTHGVRRHRRITSMGDTSAWRSGLPRAPLISSPIFIGIMMVAVFLIGMLIWSQRDIFLPDESVYTPVLAQVDQRLHVAETQDDPAAILTELDAAQSDLERADRLGAPDSEVHDRQNAITTKRDEVLGVYRLSGVRRIGSLPDELSDGRTSAYWTAGGIFLANGNLYRLNPETAQMQMMLEQGREIEGIRVGNLFGVSYDGTYLVVTDGRAAFFASSTDGAVWQSMTLDTINSQGPWTASPIDTFGESMYMLVNTYRNIYEFTLDPNQQTVGPSDWVSVGDRINLNIAVDMAIDGNIYVLLEDGQVVTLRGGLETGRFDLPGFDYESDTPVAIVNGAATGYLYVAVVDAEGNGRVIAIDKQGENAVILMLPIDFMVDDADNLAPFAGLQDIVVDEDTGRLYLINGDAVWSANYTLPALGNGDATPEAE